jgi:hypothetical protein
MQFNARPRKQDLSNLFEPEALKLGFPQKHPSPRTVTFSGTIIAVNAHPRKFRIFFLFGQQAAMDAAVYKSNDRLSIEKDPIMSKKRWNFRLDAEPSSDSSDDVTPEPLDPIEVPPPPPPDSSSSEPTPPRYSHLAETRSAVALLRKLDSDLSGDSFDLSGDGPDPPDLAAAEVESPAFDSERPRVVMRSLKQHPAEVTAPKQKRPGKRVFEATVRTIHDFFQGDISIVRILQAIHACAGDYQAAVVKLTQGFQGRSILEIPVVEQGKPTAAALREYLRGK